MLALVAKFLLECNIRYNPCGTSADNSTGAGSIVFKWKNRSAARDTLEDSNQITAVGD
jgi:hypothetical protein